MKGHVHQDKAENIASQAEQAVEVEERTLQIDGKRRQMHPKDSMRMGMGMGMGVWIGEGARPACSEAAS